VIITPSPPNTAEKERGGDAHETKKGRGRITGLHLGRPEKTHSPNPPKRLATKAMADRWGGNNMDFNFDDIMKV